MSPSPVYVVRRDPAHTHGIFLALLCLALGACATAVPQAQIDDYYERCIGPGDGATMQASYCSVAIDSGKLSRSQMALAYDKRARINESRRRPIEAERDFLLAAQMRGEYVAPPPTTQARPQLPTAQPRPEPPPAPPRAYRLVFNGLQCPKVQRDSVLYPANEIFANVVIVDENGRHHTAKLPPRGTFTKVVNGSRRSGNNQVVWSGPSQPLMFQIAVWEYDDGGPLVETLTNVAVDFALSRGRNTLTRTAVKGTLARKGANTALQEAGDALDLTSELSRHISSLPKSLLGTDNDLIGAIGIRDIVPAAYESTSRDGHFSYHFSTRHRRGGADCRFYFQFR